MAIRILSQGSLDANSLILLIAETAASRQWDYVRADRAYSLRSRIYRQSFVPCPNCAGTTLGKLNFFQDVASTNASMRWTCETGSFNFSGQYAGTVCRQRESILWVRDFGTKWWSKATKKSRGRMWNLDSRDGRIKSQCDTKLA